MLDIAVYSGLMAIVVVYLISIMDAKNQVYILALVGVIVVFTLYKKWSLPSIVGLIYLGSLKPGDNVQIRWFDDPLSSEKSQSKLKETHYQASVLGVHYRTLKNSPKSRSGDFWKYFYKFAPGCVSVEMNGVQFEVPVDLIEK